MKSAHYWIAGSSPAMTVGLLHARVRRIPNQTGQQWVEPDNDGGVSAPPPYSITGIEKSAPSLIPLGQRAVTVLVRV